MTKLPIPESSVCVDRNVTGTYVLKDGVVENFTPLIQGRMFRCSCGCNVFSKPNGKNLDLYECNGCGALYEGGV